MDVQPARGRRIAAWMKTDPTGAEFVEVDLSDAGLHATGTAIGSDPQPYRLDYTLQTDAGFVTRRVEVRTSGQGWARSVGLSHDVDGWQVAAEEAGHFPGPAAGGDPGAFADALDADLGLSPLFNTMPVLRHRLLEPAAGAVELLMVWISVPGSGRVPLPAALHGTASRRNHPALIRFETVGDGADFRADIEFDAGGIVVDYPGLATRLR